MTDQVVKSDVWPVAIMELRFAMGPIADIASVRFACPDLDAMEQFLLEFGMARAGRTHNALFMRGTGPDPVVHETRLGDPAFLGLTLRAASTEGLEALARSQGMTPQRSEAPGGGLVLRLEDPDGYGVEIVANQSPASPLPGHQRPAINTDANRPRTDELVRMSEAPSHVRRLGHVALAVKDYAASRAWYQAHFGLIVSDEIEVAPGAPIGAFLRCDRGDDPADHHTLFLIGTGTTKFNHAAFEVSDFDDLMAGHYHLKAKGRHAEWGVGRHILGSQVFDYWRDPWGHAVEHWTDGDLLSAGWGSRKASLDDLIGTQWGPTAPPTMA